MTTLQSLSFPGARMRVALATACAALFLAGCAITNPNNRPLTNWVEERLWPDSKGRRVAAAPVVLPIAVAALAADAAVIHPLSSIDDAIFDARKMWWLDMNWDEQYISECAGLPFRAALTPVTFAGDWVIRSLFDIEGEPETTESAESAKKTLNEAREMRKGGQPHEALDVLATINVFALSNRALRNDIHLDFLELVHETGRYGDFEFSRARELADSPKAGDLDRLLIEMRNDKSALVRWKAYACDILISTANNQPNAMRLALTDSDPSVRFMTLWWLSDNQPYFANALRKISADLRTVSHEDENSMVRVSAEKLLLQAIGLATR